MLRRPLLTTLATFVAGAALVTGASAAEDAATWVASPSTAYASTIRSINPRLSPERSRIYAAKVLAEAHRTRLDPLLLMAVVTVESGWNAAARSYTGAQGLGQLMPETARELGVDPRIGTANLHGAAIYLARLLVHFRSAADPVKLAVAGYNAGPAAIGPRGRIPRNGETPRYVRKVLVAFKQFRRRLGSASGDSAEIAVLSDAAALSAVARAATTYWGATEGATAD